VVSALGALLLSFLTALLLTPVVRQWALRKGVVDEPGGRRVHVKVTPRLGGLAVIVAFFLPLAVFTALETGAMHGLFEEAELVLGLVAGSVVVGWVGAVDDVRGLGPWPKLGAQATAASIAYVAGYRIETINLPVVGDLDMGIFAPVVTIVWFLAITNAINLIDGLDGLAAGIALFAAISNFFIALFNGAYIVVLSSASLAGALLGFLRYNFNPATIFLGDAGSMFLGFALAATSIAGAATKSSTAVAILAPIIALGIPIVDTMLAMVRRTLAGQSIFAADRGHIHHRLLDLGFTHRKVVLTLYGTSIFLAASAIIISFGRSLQLGAALAVTGTMLFVLVRALRAMPRARAQADAARDAAIASLGERVREAVRALDGCADYASFERCLEEFGADRQLFAKVEWGAEPRPGMLRGAEAIARGELVFELRAREGARLLEIDLSARLRPHAAELHQVLALVADASQSALHRVLGMRGSQNDLVPAE